MSDSSRGVGAAAPMGATRVQPSLPVASGGQQIHAARADYPKGELGSIGEIISDISADLATLIHQELELAKAEATQAATTAGKGVGMLGGAGVAGHMMLLFLSIAAWFAIAELVESFGWSAVIVAVIWAIIAAVLAVMGRNRMKTIKGLPRTVETVKQVPDALKGNEDTP